MEASLLEGDMFSPLQAKSRSIIDSAAQQRHAGDGFQRVRCAPASSRT
jgi:hypothetical protein